jgi:two-component system KDP operon response regulator KdpE
VSANPLILLIEDEAPLRKFLRAALALDGFRVQEAATAEEGIRLATQLPPDLVLLDLGLPDADGKNVLRQLREWLQAPVIVVSARDQEQEKVELLDAGADDYLTKPFGTSELLARVRVALRHAAKGQPIPDGGAVDIGDLHVDLPARRVYRQGNLVHLTPLEYKLLITMLKHRGKVLTHRFLLREVWGPDDSQEHHYLRVFIANLRRKLEDDPARPRHILTEQGVGYRLTSD